MVEILDPWSSLLDDDFDDKEEIKVEDTEEVDEDDMEFEADDEEEEPFYRQLSTALNDVLSLEDEDLKSIDNEEDFKKAINKTIEKKVEEEFEDWFQSTFDEEARELVRKLAEGKKISDLSLKENYDLTLERDQESLIRDYYRKINMDEEEIEENIAIYKDMDTMESKAKNLQPKLQKLLDKEEEKKKEREKEQNKEEELKRVEVLNNIKNKIIESAELKGYPLNEKDKNQLVDYITKADIKYKDPDTGKVIMITKYQKDEMERSKDMDVFLFKALQSMKGYDLSPVKKKAVTDNTKKVEENYKKMIESDTQSKFKQTPTRKITEDPFEKYLKNNK